MSRTKRATPTQSHAPHDTLEKYVDRIAEELRRLALSGDWEVMKSVFRVLDAHARAKELRAQGQPARAHLWLVGVNQRSQKVKATEKIDTPPAA